ncbi:MAG: hypothetical protein IID18_09320 [Nitrospinae bacterium]|nr:hypothetical protein [Nitrospinota bacterium]
MNLKKVAAQANGLREPVELRLRQEYKLTYPLGDGDMGILPRNALIYKEFYQM